LRSWFDRAFGVKGMAHSGPAVRGLGDGTLGYKARPFLPPPPEHKGASVFQNPKMVSNGDICATHLSHGLFQGLLPGLLKGPSFSSQ